LTSDVPAAARSLSEQFERVVARVPDAAAIVTPDGAVLSYAELARRADAVTARLVAAGLGPGSVVLVEVARTPQTIATLFGILAVGAAYVPVDPDWPTARIELIARIAGADFAFLDRDAHLGSTPTAPLGTEGPGPTPEPVVAARHTTVRAPVEGEAAGLSGSAGVAYIIFTSGSTGTPKGVKVSHGSVLAVLHWFWSVTTSEERRLTVTSTSFAFDPSVLEIFGPLLSGGAVKAVRSVWESATGSGQPTYMGSTPAVLRTLVDTGRLPGSLELLFSGGEAMTPTLARDLLAANPGMRLFNAYGPTETTVLVTAHEVPVPVPDRIPIGRPTTGTEIRLLGPDGETLGRSTTRDHDATGDAGVTGEIGVLGSQLASGYVRSAEEDGVFVPARDAAGGETRMYRTGDRGRLDADGVLWFLGRIDAQLKVRGHRVEPAEVEAALLALDGVREARVVAAGEGAGRRLVAHVLTRPGVSGDELRDRLRAQLPEHLVPSQITVGDELPVTSSGKVDRASIVDAAEVERRSQAVHAVGALVTGMLGAPTTARPEDDFLRNLGGTSLQLVMLLAELERHFGVEIHLDDVVRDTTIRGLSRLVTAPAARDDPAGDIVDLRPFDRPQQHRPRVFLIHAYFGGMLRYQRLRERLAAQWDVVLVDSQMAGHGPPPRDDIGALAEQARRLILTADPVGPYALVGHSAGGLVALEVGRTLLGEGRDVSYLGLVDSPHIGSRWELLWSEIAQNLPELPRLLSPRSLRTRFGRRSTPPSRISTAIDAGNRSTNRAVRSFRAEPYPGRVVLFSTGDGRRMAHRRPDLGWDGYFAGIEHHRIDGGHVTALDEPHVDALAHRIDESLRRRIGAAAIPAADPLVSPGRRARPTGGFDG
jgi:amino acid adenylation domain-containing protein